MRLTPAREKLREEIGTILASTPGTEIRPLATSTVVLALEELRGRAPIATADDCRRLWSEQMLTAAETSERMKASELLARSYGMMAPAPAAAVQVNVGTALTDDAVLAAARAVERLEEREALASGGTFRRAKRQAPAGASSPQGAVE